MGDFRLKVKADLDAKDLESKLAKIKKDKIPITVDVKGDKKIENLEKSLTKLKSLDTVKINVDVSSLKSASAELKSLSSIVKSLSKDKININFPKSSVNSSNSKLSIKNTINDFKLLKNLAKEINEKKISLAKLDTVKNSSQISTLENQLKKLESDYNSLYKTLGKDLNVSQIGELEQIFGKASDKIEEMKSKAKDMANSVSGISKPFNQLDAVIASNRTLSWLKNNSKAAKEYGDILTELAARQKSASSGEELQDLNKEFRQITSEAQAKGLTGKSVREEAKRAFSQIAQFAGFYGAIQNIVFEVPRQMVSAVKEVNASQIELTKVSSASPNQLNKYWDQAAESAKKYGAAINEVINSTADWSRLGYSLDEAKELSDATTLLQKVGDNMTQQSSSEGMISVLKGFQMQADQAESIVDKVNQVANTQPIDTSGLFAGLERSASSMDAANNSLEQSIALITAANSVVQDPDSVGTAFKTISMRIRGASTEMEEAGLDTEGMAESTAKLQKEIKALSGVDIMKNKTEFKSTYDILDELANKWSDLTDIQQANACLYVQKCA